MAEKAWKTHFLRSGLPLEQVVSDRMIQADFLVLGEFAYRRRKPNAIEAEFSVDIHATRSFEPGGHFQPRLALLLECKYAAPGIAWLFSREPDYGWPNEPITELNELATLRRPARLSTARDLTWHRTRLFPSQELPCCLRGVSVGHSQVSSTPIDRGLSQLRYAMPQLVLTNVEEQMYGGHVAVGPVFVLPVLVTTATLYTLKRGLPLERYETANSKDDVAVQVPFLVVEREPGPELTLYADAAVRDFYERHPVAIPRLHALGRCLEPWSGSTGRDNEWAFAYKFARAASSIMVVELGALGDLLGYLVAYCEGALSSMQSVAELIEADTGEIEVRPVQQG